MKKFLPLLALGLSLSLGVAHAADAPTAQQSKMGTCNKDAGDKKGDERKAFMKEWLNAKADAKSTQQDAYLCWSGSFLALRLAPQRIRPRAMPANNAAPTQWLRRKALKQPSRERSRIKR